MGKQEGKTRTYGSQRKAQAWAFIAALQSQAIAESKGQNSAQGVVIKRIDWSKKTRSISQQGKKGTNPRLVVKTTLADIKKLVELWREVKLTDDALRYVHNHSLREEFLDILSDQRQAKQGRGSENWHFILKLWHIDLNENEKRFDSEWKRRKSGEESNASDADAITSSDWWKKVCRDHLHAQEQPRLTSNQLTFRDGMTYELDDIPVDLGLVERKKVPKIGNEISPDRSLQPSEYEIGKKFKYSEFLEQILSTQQQGNVTKRTRIAITGEPGAGKTTLLQKIAFEVDKNGGLPIVVSLGDLRGRNLRQYLLEDWLVEAVPRRITQDVEDDFVEQFNQGWVWLLLDGVDEMATGSVSALDDLKQQLASSFVARARVVLTCRVNVWDSNLNALETFKTYRTLEVSYPEQVGQFIDSWFKKINLERGQRLKTALAQPGKERIQDLVKNPLLLALLCRTWQREEGDLPDTKAKLYQQFVDDLYWWKWKYEGFRTTEPQRQELKAKLGQLARDAIAQDSSRFLLLESSIRPLLGDPHEEESLFGLARKLGFLIHIGIAAEDTAKSVYTFFHPTFQEYFAACAIPYWDYFLKHIPDNPKQGIYRIFEPQWKEVFSLWLGHPDDEVLKRHKEELINALLEFNDGCGDKGFYRYKAYFMVATGIIEFKEYSCVDEILAQLIKWSFPKLNTEEQQYKRLPYQIKEKARAALAEINFKKVIDDLTELVVDTQQDKWIRCEVARELGKIDPGNPKAIETLIEMLLHTDPDPDDLGVSFIESANGLGEIGEGSAEAFNALVEFLAKKCPNSFIESIAWRSLGKLDPHFTIGILNRLLASSKNEKEELYYAERLGKLNSSSWKIIGIFISLLHSEDEDVQMEALDNLGNLGADMPEAIAMYDAVAALIEFLHSDEGEYVTEKIAWCLGQIGTGNLDAIDALRDLLEDSEDELTRCQAAESLWRIGAGISTDATTLATITLNEILHDTQNFYICCTAANKLKRIEPDNSEATHILIQSFCNKSNKDVPWETADNLKNTRQYKLLSSIVENLQKHINDEIYENDVVSKDYYDILWHCAQNMAYPDFYQAWHGELFPVKALEN
jgi:HEAT repeat protein